MFNLGVTCLICDASKYVGTMFTFLWRGRWKLKKYYSLLHFVFLLLDCHNCFFFFWKSCWEFPWNLYWVIWWTFINKTAKSIIWICEMYDMFTKSLKFEPINWLVTIMFLYLTCLQLKALLHGHSYSAHAMGCAAASKSIKSYKDQQKNPNLIPDGRALNEVNIFL